jgi:spermidine/putrescine transport system permease protein
MSAHKRTRFGRYLLHIYGALFIAFLYGPLLLILIYSFNSNKINMAIWSGFTLDWYRSIFGLDDVAGQRCVLRGIYRPIDRAVRNSFVVALFASIVSTVQSAPPRRWR